MGFFDFIKSLFEVNPGESRYNSDDDLDDGGNTVFCFDLVRPRPIEIRKCGINGPVELWTPKHSKGSLKLWVPTESDDKFCIVYRWSPDHDSGKMGLVPEKYVDRIYDHFGYPYDAKVIYIGHSGKRCTIECTLYNKAATRARWQEEKKQKANEIKLFLTKPYRPRKNIVIWIEPYMGKEYLIKHGFKLYLKKKTLEEYLEESDHLALIFCDDKGEEIAKKRIGAAHVMSIIRAQLSGHDIDFEVTWGYKVQVTYHLK